MTQLGLSSLDMTNLGPLSGLRIIDLVPNCVGERINQFFADFGADVIHVEPVGGCPDPLK